MADMTQPERPEGASIPASERQSSQDVVEPTHIGVARHREAREGFTPPALQNPDAGLAAPTGPADRSAVEALRREAERMAARSRPIESPSIPLGEPTMPREGGGFPIRRTIAGGLGALAVTAAGFLGFNKIHSGDEGSERPGVIITDPTLEPATPPPTFTPESIPTPETTPTPEIKSTPYNFINQKEYLDGKLTLEITDGMPTRTTVPKSIVPGVYEGETVEGVASSGFEINPEWENAAKDVVDLINFGLLYAWSSQIDIPDSQKDLVTNIDESREVQMAKWDKLQERAANGEEFNVTLKAYKDDGFVDEDVTIDIGDDYAYKIDELEKPPIQIKWQSNMGSGIRISPENKEFRIEFYDQYAGGYGSWAEKTLLSSIIVQTIGYLPELVVDQGKIMRPDVFKPDFNYQANVVRDNLLILARKYNIIPDAHSGTYSKDWSDSAIHPLP